MKGKKILSAARPAERCLPAAAACILRCKSNLFSVIKENPLQCRGLSCRCVYVFIGVRSCRSLSLGVFLFFLIHDDGDGAVTGDVQAGAEHVEDTVDAGDEGEAFHREVDALQDHREHDEAGTRDTCCADGGQRTGQDDHGHLAVRQVDAEDIRDKEGADAHVESRAIHVDRRAERQDEGGDIARYAELLLAVLHVDRQRCCTRAGREGN